jgi:hypothetical protein
MQRMYVKWWSFNRSKRLQCRTMPCQDAWRVRACNRKKEIAMPHNAISSSPHPRLKDNWFDLCVFDVAVIVRSFSPVNSDSSGAVVDKFWRSASNCEMWSTALVACEIRLVHTAHSAASAQSRRTGHRHFPLRRLCDLAQSPRPGSLLGLSASVFATRSLMPCIDNTACASADSKDPIGSIEVSPS